MHRFSVTAAVLIAGCILLFLRHSTSAQEGSGSSRASPPRATRPMTPDEFYQAFWKFINKQDAPYKKWGALPGKKGLRDSKEPHGDSIQTFANKIATDSPATLPYGSILVTENYDIDKKLTDITVMYRSKGSDSQHADWYWLKYLPNGSIARTAEKEGKKPIAGKVASCIDCHSKAAGRDLVYSNDPEEKADEK
jgi:hypothetical protein